MFSVSGAGVKRTPWVRTGYHTPLRDNLVQGQQARSKIMKGSRERGPEHVRAAQLISAARTLCRSVRICMSWASRNTPGLPHRSHHHCNMSNSKSLRAAGEDVWKSRTDKVNVELFTLTYGALVAQLIRDYEDYGEVNAQLDKMGYNMGVRLVEDFLARSSTVSSSSGASGSHGTAPSVPGWLGGRCSDFRETGEVIAKVAFKMYLNIVPGISHSQSAQRSSGALDGGEELGQDPSAAGDPPSTPAGRQSTDQFTLTLDENPLAELAELPAEAVQGGLWFSNVLVGVIRGSLEMASDHSFLTILPSALTDASCNSSTCRWKLHSYLTCFAEIQQPNFESG